MAARNIIKNMSRPARVARIETYSAASASRTPGVAARTGRADRNHDQTLRDLKKLKVAARTGRADRNIIEAIDPARSVVSRPARVARIETWQRTRRWIGWPCRGPHGSRG